MERALLLKTKQKVKNAAICSKENKRGVGPIPWTLLIHQASLTKIISSSMILMLAVEARINLGSFHVSSTLRVRKYYPSF